MPSRKVQPEPLISLGCRRPRPSRAAWETVAEKVCKALGEPAGRYHYTYIREIARGNRRDSRGIRAIVAGLIGEAV